MFNGARGTLYLMTLKYIILIVYRHKKHHRQGPIFLKQDIRAGIVFSLVYVYIFLVNEVQGIVLPVLASIFIIGFIWVLLGLLLSRFLDNKTGARVFLKIYIAAMFVFFLFEYISMATMHEHLSVLYLGMVFDLNFFDRSGVGSETLLSVFFMIAEFMIFLLVFLYFNYKYKSKSSSNPSVQKPALIFLLVMVIIIEQFIFGYALYAGSNNAGSFEKVENYVLWRPRLATAFILPGVFKKYELEKERISDIPSFDTELNEQTRAQLPNVIIIMVDSLRSDVINSDDMPFLSAQKGKFYENNYSTSNCTYYGVFSFLTGLFPHYLVNKNDDWELPIMKFFKDNDYTRSIVSGFELNWMFRGLVTESQFDSAAFVRGITHENQQVLLEAFRSMFDDSEDKSPKFNITVLTSTHFDYSYPREYSKHKPDNKGIFRSLQSQKITAYNRYRNAVRYMDDLLKESFLYLQKKGEFDNSIIVVFSDHGEEFYEEGHLYHTTALNKSQLKSALYIKMPYEDSQEKVTEATSVMDVLPTIYSYMAGKELPSQYKGAPIYYKDIPRDRRLFAAECENGPPKEFAIIYQDKVEKVNMYMLGVSSAETAINERLATLKEYLY